MSKKYSDNFKLQVVKDYYESRLGVRAIADKYGLPSKNYISNWERYLKRKVFYRQTPKNPLKRQGGRRRPSSELIPGPSARNCMSKK